MSTSIFIFRVDASQQIGSGHVMRCLTLASELRRRGAEVMFVCRELGGNLIDLIEDKGFPVVRLHQTEAASYVALPEDVAHAAWLGASWQKDAADTISALGGISPQWLIVDHYALDRRWERILRPQVVKLMVIDDLADRHHDCDLLLDHNLYQAMEARYNNLVSDTCLKLLGPSYALLREEFAEARKKMRQRSGEVKRILIFFGGVDHTNETEKTLHALSGMGNRQCEVDVVVGGGNIHNKRIQNICTAHAGFHYHCQIDNMAELLAEADLAIGAGGTATWERCAMGVPSIVTAVADNQKELAETGARNGLLFYLGEACLFSSERLVDLIKFSLYFPETLQFYSARCLAYVDANGVNRVVNCLYPPKISLRRATVEDCDAVYEWRNAEETRRYIFSAEPISLDTHQNWYSRAIENQNCILLIGEIEDNPVGVLRYDCTGSEALVSVYLVPGSQGRGVGTQLLRCGSQWVRTNYPHIRVVKAEIFRENIASLHAFERAGYKEHHLISQEVL